jgi:hypothetical protein
MLGHVLLLLRQKAGTWMDQCRVKASLMKSLCKTIIAAGIDRGTLIVQFIKSQLVALKLNIELCLAKCIIAARLTKVEITIALLNLGAHGHQLLITVRQILQRVYQALRRGR